MDNFDDILKDLLVEIKTKEQKEIILGVLDKVIKQTYNAEREFNELKDVFSGVLESLPHPIWVINEDSSLFYYNSYAKELDGILQICSNDFIECEVVFQNKNYLLKRSVKNQKILITATNITNEKRKERLASMGQISAHLAHEIRNPIGAIALIISSLHKRVHNKDKIYVLEIKKALWRVERLINATLLFSKGVKNIIPQEHNSGVIKSIIDDLISYIEYTKNIDFTYNIQHEVIHCDKELLYILLQNLILNAIESIEDSDECENGIIEIEYFVESKQILKVYDSGDFIDDTSNLFEAFNTSKVKGNGLGLALCKQILEAHNGDICYSQDGRKCFIMTF